jgi:hypothetical protein
MRNQPPRLRHVHEEGRHTDGRESARMKDESRFRRCSSIWVTSVLGEGMLNSRSRGEVGQRLLEINYCGERLVGIIVRRFKIFVGTYSEIPCRKVLSSSKHNLQHRRTEHLKIVKNIYSQNVFQKVSIQSKCMYSIRLITSDSNTSDSNSMTCNIFKEVFSKPKKYIVRIKHGDVCVKP